MKHVFFGAIALAFLIAAAPQEARANAAPTCEEEICPGVWRPVREDTPDFCPADMWQALAPAFRAVLWAWFLGFCQPAEEMDDQPIENGPMA